MITNASGLEIAGDPTEEKPWWTDRVTAGNEKNTSCLCIYIHFAILIMSLFHTKVLNVQIKYNSL